MQWVGLYTADSWNTPGFEQWAGPQVRTGERSVGPPSKEQKEEDSGEAGKMEGARKGSCARFLGWKKSIVGLSCPVEYV